MKIVICDYQTDLNRGVEYEIEKLRAAFPEAEIMVYEYQDNKSALIEVLRDADAVINTYVHLDREVLSQTKQLKCIALNAVGYNMVDLTAATEFGIPVCPAAEYCTDEVAEHTMALIFALYRGLRRYIQDIEQHVWDYLAVSSIERIRGKTIAIFGFGRIGMAVAQRAKAMGLHVLVVSGSLQAEKAQALGVEKVSAQEAFARADILSNHMALTAETANFFDLGKFTACQKQPLFINTGRGGTVVENDLVTALDRGLLRGAGLDVLASENVDFSTLGLLGRDNVIITPHAGFYSVQSARDLQDISCQSVIALLSGKYDEASLIINRAELAL